MRSFGLTGHHSLELGRVIMEFLLIPTVTSRSALKLTQQQKVVLAAFLMRLGLWATGSCSRKRQQAVTGVAEMGVRRGFH